MLRKVEAEHGIICRKENSMFGYFGWPSIAKMEDGTLIVVGSGNRIWHACPFGKSLMTMSKDNGKTWSPLMIVGDTPMDDRDSGIVNIGENKLLLTWFSYDSKQLVDLMKENMNENEYAVTKGYLKFLTENDYSKYLGSYVRISNDAGKTWEESIKVPVSAPHGPIMLIDGNILYLGKEYDGINQNPPGKIMTLLSKDKGKNWIHAGVVPIPEDTDYDCFHEPHSVQLPSGKIIGMIRYQYSDRYQNYTQFSIFTTYSMDNGKTWSLAQPTGVEGSPPHLLRHSSGTLVCVYGRRHVGYPLGEMAMISRDEGETWEKDFIIRDDGLDYDLGYPCSVELSDGSIFTVYYQKLANDKKCSLLWTHWMLPDNL